MQSTHNLILQVIKLEFYLAFAPNQPTKLLCSQFEIEAVNLLPDISFFLGGGS